MEDMVWCRSCSRSVSLAHAVAELPCPGCGGNDYLIVTDASEQDALLSLSERMQRVSRWDIAASALRRCAERGFISAADCSLSLHNLAWRKECASAASKMILSADHALTVEELRSALLRDFDMYVVDWLLQEYAGLRLVPFDSTYIVEVSDAS